MSLTANSLFQSDRRKFFMNSLQNMCKILESNVLGSGSPNESKSHQLARIGEQEIFHEPDVHHVSKVGIKRFWPWEAKMSLTAISSLESARRKFFMMSSQNMCKNFESYVFELRRPK